MGNEHLSETGFIDNSEKILRPSTINDVQMSSTFIILLKSNKYQSFQWVEYRDDYNTNKCVRMD
jgi:hypothetical protein